MSTPTVKVKPLEWGEDRRPNADCPYDHCVASTIDGDYRIEWKGWKAYDAPCVYRPTHDEFVGAYRSIDEAKSAAQADYERRIFSTIDATALTAEVERLREALIRAVGLAGAMLSNDPNEPVSDCGHVALDLWTHELDALRAALDNTGGGE